MSFLNITQSDYTFMNVKLHQPVISELAEIFDSEEDLIFTLKMITGSLKELLQINEPSATEFQVFLSLLLMDTDSFGLTTHKKQKFLAFLNLCFKDYSLTIMKESFIFKKDETLIIIDNSNFDDFKAMLVKMFDIEDLVQTQGSQSYNPTDARAARIAKMLQKDNQKRAAMNQESHKKGIIENYLEILSIGFKIPPDILSKHLTLTNLFGLHKRFLMKTSWDLDIDCRLAGGSPKESPDNWMSMI